MAGVLLGAGTGRGSSRSKAVHKVPLARILLAMLQEKKVPLPTGINPTIRKIASMAGKRWWASPFVFHFP